MHLAYQVKWYIYQKHFGNDPMTPSKFLKIHRTHRHRAHYDRDRHQHHHFPYIHIYRLYENRLPVGWPLKAVG